MLSIDLNNFKLNPNAQTLNLSQLLLTEIPTSIFNLSKLKTLDLSHNFLQDEYLADEALADKKMDIIPPQIGKLRNLEKLDCSENRIRRLPPDIAGLTQLKELILTHNNFKQLAKEIGMLKNLQRLDLQKNLFCTLQPDIFKLTQLKELNLEENECKQLPKEIGMLVSLQRLNLKKNRFSTLPHELFKLVELIELDLSNNRLLAIPPEIANLRQLVELKLSGNNSAYIPKEISLLTRLLRIYVDEIQQVEICNLTNLEELVCIKYTRIPDEICKLTKLRIFSIKDDLFLPDTLPISLGLICKPHGKVNLNSLNHIIYKRNNIWINLQVKIQAFKEILEQILSLDVIEIILDYHFSTSHTYSKFIKYKSYDFAPISLKKEVNKRATTPIKMTKRPAHWRHRTNKPRH